MKTTWVLTNRKTTCSFEIKNGKFAYENGAILVDIYGNLSNQKSIKAWLHKSSKLRAIKGDDWNQLWWFRKSSKLGINLGKN